MDMTPQEYQAYVKKVEPKSPLLKNLLLAFVIGGAICTVGQLIQNGWSAAGLNQEDAGTATSCSMVLLSAVLTGLGLYCRLARFGGAGTLVPITGFANSVVAPAVDFKSEGYVTGMAVKMFTIAGPVIVYGVTASVIYGIILVLLQSF
ncbi:MAG: stage V sporulation protein AC [Ruminococcaceae bacterium]|nr:stage V sporulation protein AC [Oscillospiraceae bacterium]